MLSRTVHVNVHVNVHVDVHVNGWPVIYLQSVLTSRSLYHNYHMIAIMYCPLKIRKAWSVYTHVWFEGMSRVGDVRFQRRAASLQRLPSCHTLSCYRDHLLECMWTVVEISTDVQACCVQVSVHISRFSLFRLHRSSWMSWVYHLCACGKMSVIEYFLSIRYSATSA
jgi:hypothetical protein